MSRFLSSSVRWPHAVLRPTGSATLDALASLRRCTAHEQQQKQQQRSLFQGSILWNGGCSVISTSWHTPTLSTCFHVDDGDGEINKQLKSESSSLSGRLRPLHMPFYQQVRWKRNVGHRFEFKTRPPTRKQKKRYNRLKKRQEIEASKHNPPGSRAGLKRQYLKQLRHDAIHDPLPGPVSPESLESYNTGHAVLESLMGNTKESVPTPIPRFLGHRHRDLHRQVASTMEAFRKNVDQIAGDERQELLSDGMTQVTSSTAVLDPSSVRLPTDAEIGLALRAFRDRYGTRRNPVGLAKALSYLLQELGVPIGALGEYSYNALLTCARTPMEARKVVDLMKQQGQPVLQYSWAILADAYAKSADYEGCVAVHEEMATHGLAPLLPSYTSLLAACYKVCSNGTKSHKERVKASKLAWEKWKEMIIVGIEPDVMAYGALLRILSTKGQPERAVNILEEMQIKGVLPTTLCFTSALRAVSTSHDIALRFEKGARRTNMRREQITAHHAKLAQKILILAENAGVEHDQGFIAALIDCAGIAGDLATAKAIYVASQIRKLDQFRTIGSDDHLARLRGENVDEEDDDQVPLLEHGNESSTGGHGELITRTKKKKRDENSVRRHNTAVRAFEEREYGKDSRILSALAKACSNAADQNGMGTMWQGRENEGYLCINSIRLLSTRGVPEYQDTSVPGEEPSDYWTEEQDFERLGGAKMDRKHGRRPKGLIPEDDPKSSIYDLSPEMQDMILDEYGNKKPEYTKMTFEDAWKAKYGENDRTLREVREAKGYIVDDVNGSPALSESSQSDQLRLMADDNNATDGFSMADFEKDMHLDFLGDGQAAGESLNVDALDDNLAFNYETMNWETRGTASASGDSLKSGHADQGEDVDSEIDDSVKTDDNVSERSNAREIQRENHAMIAGDVKQDLVDLNDLEESMFGNNGLQLGTSETVNTEPEAVTLTDPTEDDRSDFDESLFGNENINFGTGETDNTHLEALADFTEDFTEEEERLFQETFAVKQNNKPPKATEDKKATEEKQPKEERKKTDFKQFYAELKQDFLENDVFETKEPTEQQARQMYAMLHDESGYPTYDREDEGDEDSQSVSDAIWGDEKLRAMMREVGDTKVDGKTMEEVIAEATNSNYHLTGEPGTPARGTDQTSVELAPTQTGSKTMELEFPHAPLRDSEYMGDVKHGWSTHSILQDRLEARPGELIEPMSNETTQTSTPSGPPPGDEDLAELREILPMFSDQRLRRILEVFRGELGDPSMLDLVLVVRERMPDYITPGWLRKMSNLTASFLMAEAEQKDLVDGRLLTSLLSMMTSCGRINDAVHFHQTEFKRRNIEPPTHSDRLVLQMLLKQNRFFRAMAFKQKMALQSRTLDLASYGSLVDYCAHKGHLGSALILVQECINMHGTPPDEPSLKRLRILCNEAGIDDDAGVLSMIGEDPMYWVKLKYNDVKIRKHLKRGMRRHMVNQVRNAMIRG